MSGVFISYRRGDSEGQARALFIALSQMVGKDSVFMDVDSIALGRDFREILNERLGSCDVVLALIGPGWLDAKDSVGHAERGYAVEKLSCIHTPEASAVCSQEIRRRESSLAGPVLIYNSRRISRRR